MNTSDKIEQLLSKIRDNNNELIKQLRTLAPKDQQEYSKKISDLMERTTKTVSMTIKNPAANGAL